MPTPRLVLVLATIGLIGACGQVDVPDETTTTAVAPGATVTTSSTVTTPPPSSSSTTTPSTLRRTTPPTTARPLTTTMITGAAPTTTRPLTPAEATSRLCAGVASADEAIQRGSFVSGGLRLGSAISANEAVADPGAVAAARSMLRAGVKGDPAGYVSAREAASTACTRAGYPINLRGPIQCIQAPCPWERAQPSRSAAAMAAVGNAMGRSISPGPTWTMER